MDSPSRLWSQIAAESGISANRAKLAAYVTDLAKDGRSLAQAAQAVRRSPEVMKKLSRDFMIDWPDYRPFARLEEKGQARPEPRIRLSL